MALFRHPACLIGRAAHSLPWWENRSAKLRTNLFPDILGIANSISKRKRDCPRVDFTASRRQASSRPCGQPNANCTRGAETTPFVQSILCQSRIIAHNQMAVDFLHQVEGDADNDEQAGAAVKLSYRVIDVQGVGDQGRDDSDNS